MTKLEQLHLFLKFHFAHEGAAKDEVWKACCDSEYNDVEVEKVVSGLLDGSIGFTDYEIQMLSIIASPSRLIAGQTDEQYAERMTACQSGDIEAAHADADRLLVNLVAELGYAKTAAAWQAIDKWYA